MDGDCVQKLGRKYVVNVKLNVGLDPNSITLQEAHFLPNYAEM